MLSEKAYLFGWLVTFYLQNIIVINLNIRVF